MISINNLNYTIGSSQVLTDISVRIPKGGMTALIGPNGAGKSTLLSHIARLLPIQRGQIEVDDLEVGKCDERTLAKRLAILPQQVHFATRLTVRDMVTFGRYPHSQGRVTESDRKIVAQALEVFGLTDLEDRFLDTLSGGQRHKAHVAMTYAQDTDYLLLDEPLNNLDIAAARNLMTLLKNLADHRGKTIVIVLHDINFAAQYADHLLVMQNGTVAQEGRPTNLITETLLQDVFGTDARVALVDDTPVVLP